MLTPAGGGLLCGLHYFYKKNMTNKDFIKYIKNIKSANKKLSNDEIILALNLIISNILNMS